jgi:diguanylate cyclase
MPDPSCDNLVEALRKAVSRTSMMAEGMDPELDKTLAQIRRTISGEANGDDVRLALKDAEPRLIASDKSKAERAKLFKDSLLELIESLNRLPNHHIPNQHKNALETKIRSHWQSSYQWPALLAEFLTLTSITLNQETTKKRSFFSRLFTKEDSKSEKSEQDVVNDISHTLLNLLGNLALPNEYDEQLSELKSLLKQEKELKIVPRILTESINLTMIALGSSQQELTSYLGKLNKQLASINITVNNSYKAQKNLSNHRESFNDKIQQQVSETSSAVDEANDLVELQKLISVRLDNISSTMTDYKKQMVEQEKTATLSITQLRQKVSKMEKDSSSLRINLQQKIVQATTDTVTNLPNRSAYQDTIMPMCLLAQKSKQSFILGVFDIDHFKAVNDNWGHLAGDKVLNLLPRQLKSVMSEKDMVFRYGGEEFVFLLPNCSLAEGKAKAEAVRNAVEKMPFNVNGEPVPITISIGIAQLAADEAHESLFERADKYLYQAKAAGRNKVISE